MKRHPRNCILTWLRSTRVRRSPTAQAASTACGALAGSLVTVPRVVVLPFHQLGKPNWHCLGLTDVFRSTLCALAVGG